MIDSGEIVVYRDADNTLRAADEESLQRVYKMKLHNAYKLSKPKVQRNYRFLKKYFKLLKTAFDNQEEFDSFDWFRNHTLYAIGWCDTAVNREGQLLYSVKSVSFSKCSEDEFEVVYHKTLNYLIGRYGFDIDFVDHLRSFD